VLKKKKTNFRFGGKTANNFNNEKSKQDVANAENLGGNRCAYADEDKHGM